MQLHLEELSFHSNTSANECGPTPVLVHSKSKSRSSKENFASHEFFDELNGKKISEDKILRDIRKEMQKIETTPIYHEENIVSRLQVEFLKLCVRINFLGFLLTKSSFCF